MYKSAKKKLKLSRRQRKYKNEIRNISLFSSVPNLIKCCSEDVESRSLCDQILGDSIVVFTRFSEVCCSVLVQILVAAHRLTLQSANDRTRALGAWATSQHNDMAARVR